MKNKQIVSLILSLLITMPTAVYAKESKVNQTKPDTQKQIGPKTVKSEKAPDASAVKKPVQEQKQEAMEKKDEKKEQMQNFKTSMKSKHELMKTLREETIALRKDIEQKTKKLSSLLADLQAGKKTLSEEMLTSLMATAQNIKIDVEELKITAEISTEAKDTQSKAIALDFNNALASMDKIIAKYQKRLDSLKALNSDLDKVLELSNLAVSPSPADSSTPTASQSEQAIS